ncbi:MAG TPA: hypothetical protein VF077_13415 [Nitrospiraceae bacterium]
MTTQLTLTESATLAGIAHCMIASGEDSDLLRHALFCDGVACDISKGITIEEFKRGGYTEEYRTLDAWATLYAEQLAAELERVRAENAQLVAALRDTLGVMDDGSNEQILIDARSILDVITKDQS